MKHALLVACLLATACEAPVGAASVGAAPGVSAWGEAPLSDGPYALVLGTAQDGGHPQIGCRLDCCAGSDRHLVASLLLVDPAVGGRWLVDASPDLPEQVRRSTGHPPGRQREGRRPALVDGVLLTHAHMGHYTGLAQLGREAYGATNVPVLASAQMVAFLADNAPWSLLVDAGHIAPRVLLPDVATVLPTPAGVPATTLAVTAWPVPHRHEFSDTNAYLVQGPRRRLLYLPDIDKWERWERRLEDVLGEVDVALVDGTFHAEGEIPDRAMADIPHPFMVETIARLARLPAPLRAKVHFIHLNHTNPAFDAESAAARAIRAAGLSVAREGQVFAL